MKKRLMAAIIATMMVLSASAEDTTGSTTTTPECVGGTAVGKFCFSTIELNWWSASPWCQSNGMQLASIYDLCPNWDGNTGEAKCGKTYEVTLPDYAWTSTARNGSSAFTLKPKTGYVSSTDHDWDYTKCVACVQK